MASSVIKALYKDSSTYHNQNIAVIPQISTYKHS